MRARIERACGIALAVGLWAGCASDMWYKTGAGTDDLAQDKAACRSEVASAGVKAGEAFEQCMSARDWWHVATPGRRKSPAQRTRSAASARSQETAPTALAPARPSAATAAPAREEVTATDVSAAPRSAPASDVPLALEPDADVAAPTQQRDEPESPSVGAGFEEPEVEIEEAALPPDPIDPTSRQFWLKLGAGPGQLQADQRTCRRELGLADEVTEPSRWGQSEPFDACMRGRGWGGGSL